ncbi:MAG: TIGR04283 family arsenosugar biosynthesis glycosyltransferase [Candidatus Kapaibacteriales bacterium]
MKERKHKKPSISLVVPVLNEEALLKTNLISLRNSCRYSENEVEIVVCDGGSTDSSKSIAEEYADRVVEQEGRFNTIAEGRNSGAAAAKGDILVFINADTYPRNPYQFNHEISKFAETKDRFIAQGVFVHGDATIEENGFIGHFDRFFHFITNWYFWLMSVLGFTMARGECMIVKKNSFTAIGGFRGDLVAGEDVDFFRRLSKLGKVAVNKKIVVIESSRRFISEGYFKTMGRWFINDLSVRLRGKAYSKEWSRTEDTSIPNLANQNIK